MSAYTSHLKKTCFLTLLFFCSTLILHSCGEKAATHSIDIKKLRSYPKFSDLLDFFDENYSTPLNHYVDFQKKPEGYFILTTDQTHQSKKTHLFWSLEKKAYQKLPEEFNKREGDNPLYSTLISRAYNFDHSLYCNYPEADDDVINILENAENINDTLLEALTRAYILKCDEFVGTRTGNYDKKRLEELGSMSKENAKLFVETGNKLISTHEKLVERNPHYQTLVGKIKNKKSNDHLFLWYELTINGFNKEAKAFLIDGLYDSLMINYAKNILMTCDNNSIVFTAGDNDTYPLWYVQEKLNYRKDVSVINTSLANVPFYNNYHLKKHQLKTTLSSNDYQDTLLNIILLQPTQEDTSISISSFFEKLKNRKQYKELIVEAGSSKYLNFPSRIFSQPATTSYPNSRAPYNNFDLQVHANRSYFSLSDVFQLDIIYSNPTKTIYYTYPGGSGIEIYFMNYIENLGFVNQVVKGGTETEYNYYYPYFNTEKIKDLMLNKYNYAAVYDNGYSVNSIANSYYIQLISVAGQLVEKGDLKLAAEFLKKAEKEIKIDQLENNERVLFYAGIIGFDCQETEFGKKVWSLLITKIEQNNMRGLTFQERASYIDMLLSMTAQEEKIKDKDFMKRIQDLSKIIAAPPKD